MFDQLEILKMSHGLARHAAARQAAVAQNVANVDPPGYRRVGVPSFADMHGAEAGRDGLRATRPGHLGHASEFAPPAPRVLPGGSAGLNGNTVSLEDEIVQAAQLRQQHDMALTIYRSALTVMRTALGRG